MSPIVFWISEFQKAEDAYQEMYRELRCWRPDGYEKVALADWIGTPLYKRTLKERSEPIRTRIKQARAMLFELCELQKALQ